MSNLKRCTACKKEKTNNEYHKDKYRPDGLTQQCKECRKQAKIRYYQIPGSREKSRQYSKKHYKENREARMEYDRIRRQNPEVQKREKENSRKHRRTPEHRQKDREVKRKLAKDPNYKQKRKEYDRYRRETQYLKVRAREVVRKAVYRKKIPPASDLACDWSGCQKQANEYHHYKGYERENWMDIQPLCYEHHGLIHQEPS
jgi:hypothetical protein